MKTQAWVCMMILVVLLGRAAWEAPCVAGPAPPRSLEDALFDDFSTAQLHPADPKRADAENIEAPERPAASGSDRQQPWAEELGAAGVSQHDSPLLAVAQRMREVQGLLGRAQCGETTQRAQQEILENLDRLLRQARQGSGAARSAAGEKPEGSEQSKSASSSNKSGGDQTPSGPGKVAASETGKSADGSPRIDAGQRRTMLKRLWGELPPRRRQQMLQLPVEEFLPRYELQIEQYFRRLSEERKKDEYP